MKYIAVAPRIGDAPLVGVERREHPRNLKQVAAFPRQPPPILMIRPAIMIGDPAEIRSIRLLQEALFSPSNLLPLAHSARGKTKIYTDSLTHAVCDAETARWFEQK